ncbi:MAG: hypothetical protein HY369_04510 [Candidatus Aenigmarchaeota archaeon]|nr:hypothetical protein [Candidatus Aenigmarchaeota archaeon]
MNIPPLVIITILSLVLAAMLIFVFIKVYPTIFYPSCYRNTINSLDAIPGTLTLGLDRCLGDESFTLELPLASSCVEKVEFTDYGGCRRICASLTGQQADLREGCLDACAECEYEKGCIVVVPQVPSWFDDWKLWETFQKKMSPVSVLTTGDYTLDHEVFTPESAEKGLACLTFTLEKAEKYYAIDSSPGACEEEVTCA